MTLKNVKNNASCVKVYNALHVAKKLKSKKKYLTFLIKSYAKIAYIVISVIRK
jgi:hypothetical protein